MLRTRTLLSGFLLLLALPALGCGGDSLTVPATSGTLAITTSITGAEPDVDGFSVQVDGGPVQPIGATATLTTPELIPGEHTVQLSDMAGNCSVAGDNPRTVTVAAGETATVTFGVSCGATTGGLSIAAVTSGLSPDADGYTISIDGTDRGALQSNGTVTVDALTAGSHSVGLSGIAANCQVQGENVQSVTVTAGANASVAYTINCVAPPADAGSIRITSATSGADPDPDGYTFSVDGGAAQPLAVNASMAVPNLAAGDHSVRLAGVARNCTVAATNPRSVSVTSGGTADAAFAISCSATTGTVRVSVTTSGSPTDPDGYTAKLDATNPGKAIATGGNVSFTSVPAGSHAVALSGVASHCSVKDGLSRNVTVAVGATAEVGYEVTCAGTTGSIKITTATTGSSLDADYEVSVDGGSSHRIGSNAELAISNVATGDRSVTLGGLASNCTLQGSNPRTVTVTAAAVAALTFAVTCTAASTWTTVALPAGFGGSALWASSRTDIYVAGRYADSPSDYAVLHYDGQRWTEQLRGEIYRSVWGASATDVYVVGGPDVWHFDGSRWQGGPTGVFGELKYLAIWGTSPRDLFATGSNDASTRGVGQIDHYDGSDWSTMRGHGFFDAAYIYDISGNSPSDVYALGDLPSPSDNPPEFAFVEYRVVHYDGNAWTESYKSTVSGPENRDPGDGYSLTGVWAVAPNDVFLVGSAGHIIRFNGTWSPMSSPTTQDLHDVWGNSSSNVYAVGDGGILQYDGTGWSVIEATAGIRVWGAGADVFVIKKDGGEILYGAP